LFDCRADNVQLTATLESVVASHAALQATIESLQSQLAASDSQLAHLQCTSSELIEQRDAALRDVERTKETVISTTQLVSAATAPLQQEIDRLKLLNSKLSESLANLKTRNVKLNEELSSMQDDVLKKSQIIEKMKATR